MPLNLLKKYNSLLDIGALSIPQRHKSLMGVFERDFTKNSCLNLLQKQVTPTPEDGIIKMETLFTHLTTSMVDKKTRKREFEYDRSSRLHWVKHHIEEYSHEGFLLFSLIEPEGKRTYIYNSVEKYVVVLEPLRNGISYYLITAYYLAGKDEKRDKIMKKYKRRLNDIL